MSCRWSCKNMSSNLSEKDSVIMIRSCMEDTLVQDRTHGKAPNAYLFHHTSRHCCYARFTLPLYYCHTWGSNSQPHYDNSHYQNTTLLILCSAPGLDSRTASWLSASWLSASCLPHAGSFTMHIAQPRI